MKQDLNVLMVEDCEDDAKLVLRELDRGGFCVRPTIVTTEKAMRAAITQERRDIILSDFALPNFDGLSALRVAKQLCADTPLIFVSGTIGEDVAVEAMKSGAQDYVMKGNLARLAPAVRRELEQARLRREARETDCAMRESEHKYRHLFEAMSDAALLIDEGTGCITDTNVQAEVLLERSRTDILGLLQSQIYAPQDAPAFNAVRPAGIGGKRPVEFDARVVRADGVLIPVHVSVTRIELQGRSFVLMLLRDTTERKHAEEVLQSNMARVLQQESTLLALTKRVTPHNGDAQFSLRRLTEAAARALGVERVSVWRCQEALLRCVDLYERNCDRHSCGGELAASQYPAYFAALAECDVIAADDAREDGRTREFAGNYLDVSGVTSIMDIPIRLNGSLDGVFCLEHTGPKRRWSVDERTFAVAMANLVSLEFEEGERKQTEKALRLSQKAYASLVNTIDGIVWEANAQTFQFTFVSQQAERLLGYPLSDWLDKPHFWQDHIHPDDREQAMNYCLQSTREKRDHDFQYRMLTADGRLVWIHDWVTVVVENDQPAMLRGIMLDVTESRRAEEALRWRTAFFEAQVDSNLDGILVVDSQGKKILQNRRLSELWKIPESISNDPADAKQVQFIASTTKNPAQFVEKIQYLYAHTDEVSRDEIEFVDGMVLDRYSSPVRDKHGTYYGRIWTFRDITARKQLEEQLRQAQKMEAIGQLAGGVAHDFNNILTAIMMYLGMLRGSLQDEKNRETLKELEGQAQRAANLTRQLLMFSRQSAVEIKPLDLNFVIENVLKMLRRLIGEQINIDFRSTTGLPLVEADHGMMEQVLLNLSVNARDAMAGRGRLAIATDSVEFNAQQAAQNPNRRAGRFVKLAVADAGCGMDRETRKRIFEPFFTTKPIGKGTGLGLATVYGIVQQHHGWLEVESEVGAGSVFTVFLPVTNKTSPEETSESLPALRGGRETILFVEDEPTVRNLTVRCLQMLGYRVLEAANGREAGELWEKHHADIAMLLTDMIMPEGITGTDLAERFQQEKPALKVIVASGYSAEINAQGVPSNPNIHFLPKPFRAQELAAVVRQCLDRS